MADKTKAFNVLNFGADPTGAGDSQPAIGAAVKAAAAASASILYFPAGSYRVPCRRPDTGQPTAAGADAGSAKTD
jgi:polygalacturonase